MFDPWNSSTSGWRGLPKLDRAGPLIVWVQFLREGGGRIVPRAHGRGQIPLKRKMRPMLACPCSALFATVVGEQPKKGSQYSPTPCVVWEDFSLSYPPPL